MKFIDTIKKIWNNIDPIVELGIYVVIAFAISRLVNITFMQAISITYAYFVLNILRELIATIKRKHQ